MRVIVLGCGEMGRSAVLDLYRFGTFKEISVATRSPGKAREVMPLLKGRPINVDVQELDVRDRKALVKQIKGHDVVINCVGPNYKYEVMIAEAAIQARVDLIDINDDYETTYRMYDLDERAKEAGVLVVLGLGASPGINNVFVRAAADQLESVEEIHTSWVMSAADPGGLALSYHLIYSLSAKALIYKEREMVEVESFVDGREEVEFPDPVGPLDVYHVGHPEPVTLSRAFPEARIVNDKATFHPSFFNELIRGLGKLVRDARGPIRVDGAFVEAMDFAAAYFHQMAKGLDYDRKEGALRIDVKGRRNGDLKKVTYMSSGLIANGTGIPAAMGAQMLTEGYIQGKGVLAPEECVDWRHFIQTIVTRRVGQLLIKERDV